MERVIHPVFTCSKTTIGTLEQYVISVQSRCGIFILKSEQISHSVLMFSLLTLNKKMWVG